jgi:serine/threonine-protein kinase
MPAAPEPDRDEALLEDLVKRGWATEEQASEARRLKKASEELGQPATLDEILVRKGVASDRVASARREVAARDGQVLRIGKYEILQRLGEGGSGIVYRAHQTTLGREVALKVLSQRREGEEEYLARFNREAQVAVTLNHVNIVRGLDFGYADGYHYFAMELVEGESLLAQLRRSGRLPERKALDVGLQIVRALEHAAKFRIVHRDIKPENILITRSGTAKLCDLGLARPILEGGAADSEGRPVGTALYVSPEQVRRSKDLDFRADVYALGATLYHALTGVPPYTGQSVPEILRAHLHSPVPNPRDRVLDLGTGTAAVVMKMLAKDPADRYPSLEALDEDLDAVVAGRPPVNTITLGRKPLALGEGAAPRAAGERKSGPGAGLVVGVVSAVALLGTGAWFAFGRGRAAPPPPPPPPPVNPGGGGGKPDLDASRIREAQENDAAQALAAVDAIAKEKGPDAPEVGDALLAVAANHPSTSAGRVAKSRAEDFAKRRAERIRGDLATRTAAFDAALGEGRLGEALAAWEGLTAEAAAAGGTASAAEAKTRVDAAAAALVERAKGLVARATDGDSAQEGPARDAIAAAEGAGLAPVAEEARRLRESLDAALRDRRDRLRAAEEAWPRTCAEALAAGVRDVRAGVAVVEAAEPVLAPLPGRAAALRRALGGIASFLEAARKEFDRAGSAGESVRLRVAGRPGGAVGGRAGRVRGDAFEIQRGPVVDSVPVSEVAPEDIAALAWKTLGAGTPADHAGAAAFHLARGSFALADAELKVLDVLGDAAEAAGARAISDAVRAAARSRADADLREAEVFRIQKRLPEQRAALEKAAAEDPGYAEPRWRLGALLLEGGKEAAEAGRWLESSAALEPAAPEAWYWIGESRRRAGRIEDAILAFDRYMASAPQDDPRRDAARKSLEEIRGAAAEAALKANREEAARALRKEDFRTAEDLWRKVLAARPDETEAMYFLAKSLAGLDRKFEAYAAFRRFLAAERRGGARVDDAKRIVKEMENRLADSEPARRRASEGTAHLDAGRLPEAIAAFDEAVALAPLRVDTWTERARALQFLWIAEGRKERLLEALRDLETALLVNERHGRAWSLLAVTKVFLEDWEGAVAAGARSAQYDPSWRPGIEARAQACGRTGRFAEAEQAATDGIGKEPSAMLYIARADARVGLGRLKEARADLDAAEEKFKLTPTEKQYHAQVTDRFVKAQKAGQ